MVVWAACFVIVKTFEDSSAVNHCAQVRITFNIIDNRYMKERMKCRKNEGIKKER